MFELRQFAPEWLIVLAAVSIISLYKLLKGPVAKGLRPKSDLALASINDKRARVHDTRTQANLPLRFSVTFYTNAILTVILPFLAFSFN